MITVGRRGLGRRRGGIGCRVLLGVCVGGGEGVCSLVEGEIMLI